MNTRVAKANHIDEPQADAMMDVTERTTNGIDRTAPREAMQAITGVNDRIQEEPRMESDMVVSGAIIDSWVELSRELDDAPRVVLQVAPNGRPRDLIFVEAEASLVPDSGWLEDLRENTCHGSPVEAFGRRMLNGFISATRLQLVR